MNFDRLFTSLAMTIILAVLSVPANAADSSSTDEWEFDGAVYLWGATIDATPNGGDEIEISFSDILDDLDMALMTSLGARKDKWSLLADIIYLDIEDDQNGSAELIGQSISTDVDVELKAWIINTMGGYRLVETDKYSLNLMAGARYLWLEIPLEFQIGSVKEKVSPSGHILDGILGVRGKVNLADKLYLSYQLDGGTGDSDFTWQGLAGLNYKFNKFNAVVGYRYLDWDIDGSDIDDITVKGPYAGAKFAF